MPPRYNPFSEWPIKNRNICWTTSRGSLLSLLTGSFFTKPYFNQFILAFPVLMVLIGLGMMVQRASSNTVLQTIVEDDKQRESCARFM